MVMSLDQHQVSVNGNYIPSSFGCSIEALVRLFCPISEVSEAKLQELVSTACTFFFIFMDSFLIFCESQVHRIATNMIVLTTFKPCDISIMIQP